MVDLRKIEERLAAATPGPWQVDRENDTGPNDDGYWEWYTVGPVKIDIDRFDRDDRAKHDAALLANLHADMNALIARVRELEKEANRLRFIAGPSANQGR